MKNFEENQQQSVNKNSDIPQENPQTNKYDRLWLLDRLRELAPISQYAFAKAIGIHYPTLINIVREWEFMKLITSRMEIRNNHAVKILIVNKMEEKKK